ncbi:hypothetical protein NL108_017775 [Boleophthalmus pectinirostris]|nr:hypothetical protein NL108_017775 [Boleophthalmus pectinirostris]
MADYDVLLRELRDFRQENREQLEGIKDDIAKVNNRLEEAEERIEKAEERIQNTEDAMAGLVQLHMKLEDKLTDLESRTRRENIRIYGVPEESERDSPTVSDFVECLLREGLRLDDVKDIGIERAHRSLGPAPKWGPAALYSR